MQYYGSHLSQPSNPIQQNSLNQANASCNTILGSSIILLPICIVLGGVLHRRYRAYRAAVLCQQIETLERLWRMSPKK